MATETETLGRKTARTLSAVLIGQILSIIITGITIILLARLLQPASYGVYTFAFGYSSFIDAVGGLGIGAYLSRHFAIWAFKRDHEKMMRVLSSGYLVLVVSSLLLTLIAVGLSGYLAHTLYASLNIPEATLITSALMIFFVMIQSVSTQALIGLGKGAFSSFSVFTGNVVQLVASVGLILYGYGAEGALLGMLIGYIISAIIGTLFVQISVREYGKIKLSRPTREELREVMAYSFPIGLNNIVDDGMQNFSILFLGLFSISTSVLGNYGAALKGLSAIILIQNSVNNVLLPTFAAASLERKDKELHKTYNRVLGYSLAFIIPLLVYIAVFSQPLVLLFLSKAYSLAPTYLSLITAGAILITVSLFISRLLMSGGKTLEVLKYNVIVAIVEVLLMVILTPVLNGYGLAVIAVIVSIFVAGSTVSVLLFMRGARNLFGVKFDLNRLFRIFLSNILLALVLAAFLITANYLTHGSMRDSVMAVELVVGILVTLLAYPFLLSLTGALNREDMTKIEEATYKLPIISPPIKIYMKYAGFFMG